MAQIKTPEQIAEDAARKVLSEHAGIQEFVGTSAGIDALAWDLVDASGSLIVEHALTELVRYAVEADRAKHSITLEFEDAETLGRALEYLGESDAPVMLVSGSVITGGRSFELWDGYDQALAESVKEYGA